MLKATIVFPDGSRMIPNRGTPQGGTLSQILSKLVDIISVATAPDTSQIL